MAVIYVNHSHLNMLMNKLFYILAVAICFTSCKKYYNASDFKGRYIGKLQVTGPNLYVENRTELQLLSPQFEVRKNGDPFGSGTFKVEDRTTITFADTHTWPANFDWNTILNGTYRYQTLGDSLILTKVMSTTDFQHTYQYRLKRVKD